MSKFSLKKNVSILLVMAMVMSFVTLAPATVSGYQYSQFDVLYDDFSTWEVPDGDSWGSSTQILTAGMVRTRGTGGAVGVALGGFYRYYRVSQDGRNNIFGTFPVSIRNGDTPAHRMQSVTYEIKNGTFAGKMLDVGMYSFESHTDWKAFYEWLISSDRNVSASVGPFSVQWGETSTDMHDLVVNRIAGGTRLVGTSTKVHAVAAIVDKLPANCKYIKVSRPVYQWRDGISYIRVTDSALAISDGLEIVPTFPIALEVLPSPTPTPLPTPTPEPTPTPVPTPTPIPGDLYDDFSAWTPTGSVTNGSTVENKGSAHSISSTLRLWGNPGYTSYFGSFSQPYMPAGRNTKSRDSDTWITYQGDFSGKLAEFAIRSSRNSSNTPDWVNTSHWVNLFDNYAHRAYYYPNYKAAVPAVTPNPGLGIDGQEAQPAVPGELELRSALQIFAGPTLESMVSIPLTHIRGGDRRTGDVNSVSVIVENLPANTQFVRFQFNRFEDAGNVAWADIYSFVRISTNKADVLKQAIPLNTLVVADDGAISGTMVNSVTLNYRGEGSSPAGKFVLASYGDNGALNKIKIENVTWNGKEAVLSDLDYDRSGSTKLFFFSDINGTGTIRPLLVSKTLP